MSEVDNVTFVDGHAVSQEEPVQGQAPADEREAAIKAVKEALKGVAKESADNADKASKQDPYKPEGAKAEKKEPKKAGEKEEEDAPKKAGDSGKSERDAQGRFLPKEHKESTEGSRQRPAEKPTVPTAKESGEEEEAPKSEPAPDPRKASVKELLKNREKLAKEKLAVKEEINAEREAFRREQEAFRQEQARLMQEREFLRQQAARIQALKSDPARAVREAGWDPEEFIMSLAREGTPEGQLDRQTRQLREELAQIKAWKEQQAREAQEYQRRAEYERLYNYRQEVERQFLGTAINEDKYPHIANFYKGREGALISEGDIIAAEFRNLSGGREASFDEVADYIEEELASRFNNLYSKRYGNGTQQATGSVNVVKPAKGSKGKSLSPGMASERRTLGKELMDLDGEERILAAREAVGMALAEARKNTD